MMQRIFTIGTLILSTAFSVAAFAGESVDLEFKLHFKAFCKNDIKEVQVTELNEPVIFRLRLNNDGSTRKVKPHVYHLMNSAGYDVFVSLEILREKGQENFHIRLTPWRRVNNERDISFGTAFLEQATPTPIANLGVAVNEEINEATGSYCTLTATIASK